MNQNGELPLQTTVDDELYDELNELVGQQIVYVEVWEDSLGGAMEDDEVTLAKPTGESAFDIDLYLADGVYFELYSVSCFDDPDADPWRGLEVATKRLQSVARRGVLEEVAVDEDDGLVLVLRDARRQLIYLSVGAWLLEEWDELPTD